MNKKLLKSRKDFYDWVEEHVEDIGNMFHGFENIQDVEELFGLQFLTESFDPDDEFWWETGAPLLEPLQYIIREDALAPEMYPCLVVFWLETDFDRVGTISTKIVEFVYLTDFDTK